MKVRIIGPGKAGGAFAAAWSGAGIETDLLDRNASVADAATGVDAVLIATPDRVIAEVAQAIVPGPAVVLHCSGATGIGVLAHHRRYGSIHPLMALPDDVTGAARMADRGWFAVAGDPLAGRLVDALGGQQFVIGDDDRALYHATAAVAANHLVALLAQVERLAAAINVPVEAFLDMSRSSLGDVAGKGAAASLTGPAARGDIETLEAHQAALPAEERELYEVLMNAAQRLAGKDTGSP